MDTDAGSRSLATRRALPHPAPTPLTFNGGGPTYPFGVANCPGHPGHEHWRNRPPVSMK
jgi:hypothetical protein